MINMFLQFHRVGDGEWENCWGEDEVAQKHNFCVGDHSLKLIETVEKNKLSDSFN